MEGELPGPASSPFTVCQALAALVYLRGSGGWGAMGCLSSKRRSWAALSVGGPAPSDGETEGGAGVMGRSVARALNGYVSVSVWVSSSSSSGQPWSLARKSQRRRVLSRC